MPARFRFLLSSTLAAAALAAPAGASAQNAQPYEGFLCCSMLLYRGWMDDQNYDDGYKEIVPAGTPMKFTGFGRYRLRVEANGKKLELGNQYSRTMSMDDFAARYLPMQDPTLKARSWPANVRDAIAKRKVMRGMTREQVIMALGYPTLTTTPDLAQVVWTYEFRVGNFQVFWSDDGRIDRLFGPQEARAKVWLE